MADFSHVASGRLTLGSTSTALPIFYFKAAGCLSDCSCAPFLRVYNAVGKISVRNSVVVNRAPRWVHASSGKARLINGAISACSFWTYSASGNVSVKNAASYVSPSWQYQSEIAGMRLSGSSEIYWSEKSCIPCGYGRSQVCHLIVKPSTVHFYEPSGSLGLSGDATVISTQWHYTASGDLRLGNESSQRSSSWWYVASGNLRIGDTAPFKAPRWNYSGSGGLSVGDSVGYVQVVHRVCHYCSLIVGGDADYELIPFVPPPCGIDILWRAPRSGYARVELWGAGGGGHLNETSELVGLGGGGGAYARLPFFPVTGGQNYLIHIGCGGNPEEDGGDSWFINPEFLLAKGGLGGGLFVAGAGGSAELSIGPTVHAGGDGGESGGGGGSSASDVRYGNPGNPDGTGGLGPVERSGDGGDIGIDGHFPGGGGGANARGSQGDYRINMRGPEDDPPPDLSCSCTAACCPCPVNPDCSDSPVSVIVSTNVIVYAITQKVITKKFKGILML